MTTIIKNEHYQIPIYPEYVNNSNLESLKTSFLDTYGDIHDKEVINRLFTAFKVSERLDSVLYPIMTIEIFFAWLFIDNIKLCLMLG